MNKQIARNLLWAMVHLHVQIARFSPSTLSSDAVFNRCWNALRGNKLAAYCASHTRHRFQPAELEVLMLATLQAMRSQGFIIEPRAQILAPDTTLALLQCGHAPLIAITSHTGFFATTRSLLQLGLPVTLVTDALPEAELKARYKSVLDHYPDLQLVPKDRYCLGHLREALRARRTVSCAADFQDSATKTYSLISPAIFEFARRLKIDVLLSKTTIDEDGSITTRFDGPHQVTDAIASAESFMRLLNEGRRPPKKLAIGYTQATA